MPLHLEVSIAGDVQLRREILRVGDRAIHAQPAFEVILEQLFDLEAEQFRTEGRTASGGWDQIRQSTIDAKGGRDEILVDTGNLRSSLTKRGGDNVAIATDDLLVFGTTDPVAALHQHGTTRMPRRRPLELPEWARAGFVRVLQLYIVRGQISGGHQSTFDRAISGLEVAAA